MKLSHCILLCPLTYTLLFSSLCFAQKSAPTPHPNPLSISPKQITKTLKRYQKNPITIDLKLIDGYKAYLDQFQLEAKSPRRVVFSSIEVTPTIVFYDKFFHKEREGLIGQGQLSATFELPKDMPSGPYLLEGLLVYQACTDDFCLLPKRIPFSLNVELPEDKNESTVLNFNRAMEKGLLWTLLLVFVAGFLTSLTPCVFPMIPITLSILGTQVIGQSRLRGFALSLCYVLGVGITYATLGMMAAQTGALFGAFLASPFVISCIVILFILMGLSMYGIFAVQTPQWMTNKLAKYQTEKSLMGLFIAGLISGVVASPCIGPILIGILTYVTQTQDVFLGFFLLFTFAMGLGVLFLILGTFSQCLNWLPKSSAWMEGIKFFFGTIMIAMAFYYLHTILVAPYFQIFLGLACFLMGSFFFWHFGKSFSYPSILRKSILIIFCLTGISVWSLPLFPLIMSNRQQTQKVLKKEESLWKPFTEELFHEGLEQKRPIIIDFTAQWCSVCKALETHTFNDLDVKIASEKFLLLKIDATLETKDVAKWIADFQVLGLPTVLFYNQEGVLQKDLTLTNFEDPKGFLRRMNTVFQ